MSDTIKIAVDAMGGDGSPKKVIDGIIHNYLKEKNNFPRNQSISKTYPETVSYQKFF